MNPPLVSFFAEWTEYFSFAVVVLLQRVPRGAKHWNPLGPKQKSALKLYDDLRENAGFDAWDIVYYSKGDGRSEYFKWNAPGEKLMFPGQLPAPANQSSLVWVRPHKVTHTNIRIPDVNQSPPPNKDGAEHEDWKVPFGGFQEWLGLACIGSQR